MFKNFSSTFSFNFLISDIVKVSDLAITGIKLTLL